MNQPADIGANVASVLIDTLIASNQGDHQAFSYNDKRYSYQDVAALMNRAGSMVKALGVETGAAVLLLLPASPAWIASLLGSIKAGAVPLLGAPIDSGALEQCVATARPAAAVVHEARLSGAERALAAIPRDAVVVVGSDARGYKSFVDELRVQPSWFAAQPISGNAPALAIWTGSGVRQLSHDDVASFVHGNGQPLGDGDGTSAEISTAGAMLRAFSRGESAKL